MKTERNDIGIVTAVLEAEIRMGNLIVITGTLILVSIHKWPISAIYLCVRLKF